MKYVDHLVNFGQRTYLCKTDIMIVFVIYLEISDTVAGALFHGFGVFPADYRQPCVSHYIGFLEWEAGADLGFVSCHRVEFLSAITAKM